MNTIKRKQVEYDILKLKIPKSEVGRIQNIAALQNKEFDETAIDCLKIGIEFRQNNYLLQERAHKILVLDNMLLQLYPFLYKNYCYDGINIPIFEKSVQLWCDLRPIIVQKSRQFSQKNREIIEIEARRVFEFIEENFNDEYKELKAYIFNKPRTKEVKALFKPKKKKPIQELQYIVGTEKKVKQTYKDLEGKFKTCESTIPPLGMTEKEYEVNKK